MEARLAFWIRLRSSDWIWSTSGPGSLREWGAGSEGASMQPALALGDDFLVAADVGGGVVEQHGVEVGQLDGIRCELDGALGCLERGPLVARAGGVVVEDGGGAGVHGAGGRTLARERGKRQQEHGLVLEMGSMGQG
jgi:hypothetical protein